MAIKKSKHAGDFTILPNEVFRCNLSIEAIGLLACLLKLPHDWVIQKTYLHSQLDLGREKLDRIFKELQDKGFIISVKQYDINGRFTYDHIVYDKPFNNEPLTESPSTASPSTEKPLTANQHLYNKEVNNKDILNKEISKKEINKESVFSFESFWNLYPNKVAKEKCKAKYNQLTEKERGEISATIGEFLAHKPFATYTHPHPLTYLNQKRWQDEIQKQEVKEIKWE